MKTRIKNWFNKKVIAAQWIHRDKQSRIKFKWIYSSILCLFFLMFVSSVILFYYYGLRFDSKKPLPYDNGNKNAFLVSGLALFFLATICTVFIGGLYFPLVFKNSKALYMQTDEYKQQVSKYSEIDLSKKDKKEIKWLKKLEWISKNQYQQAITKLKNQTTG